MQPRATENKHQVRHQVGHLARARTEEECKGGWVAGVQQPAQRVSRAGIGEVEQGRTGQQVQEVGIFVPVSIVDEVTKTILNSPKALTASCDRCYCPRQSNTTVWIRKGERKTTRKRVQRRCSEQRLGPGRHTDTREEKDLWWSFRPGGAAGND